MPHAEFRIQIATVYGLEADVIQDALALAGLTGDNVGLLKKPSLAGPNDIIYLLAGIDFWREFLPWASAAVATGALGAVGKRLYEKYFPSREAQLLLEIDHRQKYIGEHLEKLISRIDDIERYHRQESEIRVGFPYIAGPQRGDPGVVLQSKFDLPLAVIMLNASGERVKQIIDDSRSVDGNVRVGNLDIFTDGDVIRIRYGAYINGKGEIIEEEI